MLITFIYRLFEDEEENKINGTSQLTQQCLLSCYFACPSGLFKNPFSGMCVPIHISQGPFIFQRVLALQSIG